jgi:hypothetical protein
MKIRDQRQEQLRDFGELFDITFRRHKANEQSTAAFHVIKDNLTARQLFILTLIRQHANGITTDEISEFTGWPPNAISGRVSELKRMGKIYKSGTRRTRSGCSAAILKTYD